MTKTRWNPRKWLDAHGKKVRVCFVDGKKDKDLEFGKLDGCLLSPEGRRLRWTIKIDSNEPEVVQRRAFMHELYHLADDVAGELLADETVTVESQILFDILDANRGVASWIAGDGDP